MSSTIETTNSATGDAGTADHRPTLAVEMTGVTKLYQGVAALSGFDMTVPVGSIFGLIGPNGAGKTTAISMIATLLKPTSGRVAVFGLDPLVDPYSIREKMGYMPDGLGTYDSLTVEEYLQFFASAYRIRPDRWNDLLDGLLELVGLRTRRTSRVDSLSKGLKQRVVLARALIHDPELLVLDEPANGLDPRARAELRDLLLHLNQMGKTIIVSSHILAELEDVCTDVAIVQRGTMLTAGPTHMVLDSLDAGRRIRVKFVGGDVETFEVADEADQADLLRRLVTEGRDVIEFSQISGGLEGVFLSITKGIDDD